jgi:hypothetical protein
MRECAEQHLHHNDIHAFFGIYLAIDDPDLARRMYSKSTDAIDNAVAYTEQQMSGNF